MSTSTAISKEGVEEDRVRPSVGSTIHQDTLLCSPPHPPPNNMIVLVIVVADMLLMICYFVWCCCCRCCCCCSSYCCCCCCCSYHYLRYLAPPFINHPNISVIFSTTLQVLPPMIWLEIWLGIWLGWTIWLAKLALVVSLAATTIRRVVRRRPVRGGCQLQVTPLHTLIIYIPLRSRLGQLTFRPLAMWFLWLWLWLLIVLI